LVGEGEAVCPHTGQYYRMVGGVVECVE